MLLRFNLDGTPGSVSVAVRRNNEPRELGGDEGSLGLPTCTALVSTTAQGYRAMCGWIQVVQSNDNSRSGDGFDMDRFAPTGADSPYAFYGLAAPLFDAPSRSHRRDFDWLAHAFLAHTPLGSRSVVVLTGFSWGFRFRAGVAHIVEPSALTPADWKMHAGLLEAEHPDWNFPASRTGW